MDTEHLSVSRVFASLGYFIKKGGSLSVLEVRPKEVDFRESELSFSRNLGELVGPYKLSNEFEKFFGLVGP